MMNFRLSYNGPSGFDYTGFDTEKEALSWAERQEELGLIKALKLMQYDSEKDEYQVIADLSKSKVKNFPSLDEQIASARQRTTGDDSPPGGGGAMVKTPPKKTLEPDNKSEKPTFISER